MSVSLIAAAHAPAAMAAQADLSVSLSADSVSAGDGGQVAFTATVTNLGPSPTLVLLRLNMGEGERAGGEFLYSSSEQSGFELCSGTDPGSTSVSCFRNSLPLAAGSQATITVRSSVQVEGSGGPVPVTASANSNGSTEDPNHANDSARTTITLSPRQGEEEASRNRGSGTPSTGEQPTVKPTAPSGTSACLVPKLAGKTLAAAKKALAKAHCKLGTLTRRRARGRAGLVLSQKPKAGTRLSSGGRVALVLSRH